MSIEENEHFPSSRGIFSLFESQSIIPLYRQSSKPRSSPTQKKLATPRWCPPIYWSDLYPYSIPSIDSKSTKSFPLFDPPTTQRTQLPKLSHLLTQQLFLLNPAAQLQPHHAQSLDSLTASQYFYPSLALPKRKHPFPPVKCPERNLARSPHPSISKARIIFRTHFAGRALCIVAPPTTVLENRNPETKVKQRYANLGRSRDLVIMMGFTIRTYAHREKYPELNKSCKDINEKYTFHGDAGVGIWKRNRKRRGFCERWLCDVGFAARYPSTFRTSNMAHGIRKLGKGRGALFNAGSSNADTWRRIWFGGLRFFVYESKLVYLEISKFWEREQREEMGESRE